MVTRQEWRAVLTALLEAEVTLHVARTARDEAYLRFLDYQPPLSAEDN